MLTITSFLFVAALLAVATMGYAIQRGATCTVAAVDELLSQRRATKLVSLAEASLWVAGGLLVLRGLMSLPSMPAGYALTGWTVAGAVLLGLGAWVNGACVFGSIARFGSGEWAYLLTPLGFFLGCLGAVTVGVPNAQALPAGSPVLELPGAIGFAFVVYAAWRVGNRLLRVRRSAVPPGELWSPHAATTVIGLTFLATLLLAGAWAYTDLLADLARGMAGSLTARVLLALALLGGAAFGGWRAGRWKPARPRLPQLLRCLAGGALMGCGSLLIPGGNDGLILIGMPLLWPYAWVAFATMCGSIAAATTLSRRRAVARTA